MRKIDLDNLPEGFTLGTNDKGILILTFPGGKILLGKDHRYILSFYSGKGSLAFPYYQPSHSSLILGCALPCGENEIWVADPNEVVFSNDPRYLPMLQEQGFSVDPATMCISRVPTLIERLQANGWERTNHSGPTMDVLLSPCGTMLVYCWNGWNYNLKIRTWLPTMRSEWFFYLPSMLPEEEFVNTPFGATTIGSFLGI